MIVCMVHAENKADVKTGAPRPQCLLTFYSFTSCCFHKICHFSVLPLSLSLSAAFNIGSHFQLAAHVHLGGAS